MLLAALKTATGETARLKGRNRIGPGAFHHWYETQCWYRLQLLVLAMAVAALASFLHGVLVEQQF